MTSWLKKCSLSLTKLSKFINKALITLLLPNFNKKEVISHSTIPSLWELSTIIMFMSVDTRSFQRTNRESKNVWINRLNLKISSVKDGSVRPLWRIGKHLTTRWRLTMLLLWSRLYFLRLKQDSTDMLWASPDSQKINNLRILARMIGLKTSSKKEILTLTKKCLRLLLSVIWISPRNAKQRKRPPVSS